MAKRFGGKYSPNGSNDGSEAAQQAVFDESSVDAAGARVNILFLPGILLLFTSLNDGPFVLVMALVGAGILTISA